MSSTTTASFSVTPTDALRDLARASLSSCAASFELQAGDTFHPSTPLTGETLLECPVATADNARVAIATAREAFLTWRMVPAPLRGAVVKRLGELLAEHKADIAELITLEAGKIRSEALGEVQEMIDICDFAVGLSRQLYGRTMPSERPGHRLAETWHPLGVVAVISAFNFPAAVWSWNTAIALVCGNAVVWKPSPQAPLTAMASSALLARALREHDAPAGVHQLVIADASVSQTIVDSPDVALVSATGSERMGAIVGPRVASRFGRCILELGGNNAAIVTPSADLDLATRGIVFAAAGTAGQRCTTMRRLIVHESIADELVDRLVTTFAGLRIGDPTEDGVLVGPLVNAHAYEAMQAALRQAEADGGAIVTGGGRRDAAGFANAYYVEPAIVRMPNQTAIVHRETFAPILYVMKYTTLDQAVQIHNAVPQGLSSSIFTSDQREAERFIAADGSDCGICNVNIGTSGAEIGGAFGGEKTTGGGRESGSDAWRQYMRRATTTINYSDELPLAQGVNFG